MERMPAIQTAPELRWSFLGRIAYRETEALQARLRQELRGGGAGAGAAARGAEHLLLLEHPHVYTLGRNADAGDVLAGAAWLAERGIEVAESDRGGQVTYHGPGQLVGYPIFDLRPDRQDVRRYVRNLEEVLIDTLADYGIAGKGARGRRAGGRLGGRRKASPPSACTHLALDHHPRFRPQRDDGPLAVRGHRAVRSARQRGDVHGAAARHGAALERGGPRGWRRTSASVFGRRLVAAPLRLG